MSKKENRYEKVHKIKELAKRMEAKNRADKAKFETKEQYVKTINDETITRNWALEAYLILEGEKELKPEYIEEKQTNQVELDDEDENTEEGAD